MPLPRVISSLFTCASPGFWRHTVAAAVTGALLVFSFEPFNYSFLAWLALAPLLYVLSGGVGWRRAVWTGWLAGVIFFFLSTNWITHSMIQFGGMLQPLAYGASFLFSSVAAIFPALFAIIIAQLARSYGYRALLLAPFVWAATEWLRPLITGASWNALGITQVNFPLAHWASVGGVYLLSWMIALASVLLVVWRRMVPQNTKFAIQFLIFSGIVFLASIFYVPVAPLFEFFGSVSSPVTVSVVAVQPDIPISLYDSPNDAAQYLERTLRLTREAVSSANDQRADLIVWAESPLILNYEEDETVRTRLNSLVQETGSHLIFNGIARDGERYFNSAQTLAPPGASGSVTQLRRYDKIRLVPFGEYVPFRRVLGYFVPAMVGDFTPGGQATVNTLRLRTQRAVIQNEEETGGDLGLERTTNFARTSAFICYEAAYPNLVRQFVRNGATLLVNISNDAWFGNTAGARQHLAHARMRAIENDRALIRVTNSGVSALINARGRVVNELPMFTATSAVWQARLNNQLTFYTRHGDWFAIACAIISALAVALSFVSFARKTGNHE
jgi:apolipoprotein N-acyltransferase